jgi:hypothetical protein
VHLTTESVACVLEVRDSESRPGRSVVLVGLDNGLEEFTGTIEVGPAAGSSHERRKKSTRLKILF